MADPLITPAEARTLAQARKVLAGLSERFRDASRTGAGEHRAYNLGIMRQAAEQGEDGVFQALNCISSYGASEEAREAMGSAGYLTGVAALAEKPETSGTVA